MKPQEGVVQLAMGMGKIVVEGGETIRFSPAYPKKIVQFGSAINTAKSSQKHFYALKMHENCFRQLWVGEDATLQRREVKDAIAEAPFHYLASTYDVNDARIRDSFDGKGIPVLTFASILKFGEFPLSEVIQKMLEIGKRGFGCDIEIEFAVNLNKDYDQNGGKKWEFVLLQARPMISADDGLELVISDDEKERALCYSTNALGRGISKNIRDIIFVNPECFSSVTSMNIVPEISALNHQLEKEGKKYLLVGTGRWGSSDHCLGVPVQWNDISAVAGIIEAGTQQFSPDPSQGTHFFQNITSLGIAYFTVYRQEDRINWNWLKNAPALGDFNYIKHIRLDTPIAIKVEGRRNMGVILC